jgi:hypothetical protein
VEEVDYIGNRIEHLVQIVILSTSRLPPGSDAEMFVKDTTISGRCAGSNHVIA